MNGAHGEAKVGAGACGAGAVPQLLDFFALDGTGIPRAGKRSVGNASGGTGKRATAGFWNWIEKTYYAEEFCYDGKVYLFGGGHLAQEHVPVLHHLDFCCIVLDDREEDVDEACYRTPGRPCCVVPKLDEIVWIWKKDYLVIVTRGHRCDADAEAFALRTGASYISVVGSRRKTVCARKTGSAGFYRRTARQCLCPGSESRSEARRRRRLQSAFPHS